MALDVEKAAAGLVLGLLGCGIIVLYTRLNRGARGKGSTAHWATGWLLGSVAMTTLGVGWALLCFSEPRFESRVCQILGAVLCALSLGIYVLSARHVGRWRRPSSYSLGLCTVGIHGRVRHPQALALCVLPPGLGLLSGSIPLLVTAPLWIAFWVAYTCIEERLELIPAFGDEYLRYRQTTPRLFPRLWKAARASGKAADDAVPDSF